MKPVTSHSASQRNLYAFKPRVQPSPRSPVKATLLPPLRAQPSRCSFSQTLLMRARSEEPCPLHCYSLMRTIGTGSFARVRVAVEKSTNEVVVIKIISKSMALKRNQLVHVKEEHRLLESLRHPFLVGLKSAFQDQFFLYLVLEYVQGGDLYSLLAKNGSIEAHDAKLYASEVVCALSYLHSKNIAYRDLKPENLLLTSTGHIKLTDFGLAKEVRERTYTLCGTPQYLSPEMITREGHDERCDWWAVGVLMYEMLVGSPPFEADSPYSLYERILTEEAQYPIGLPREVRALIATLLIKDQSKRASERQIKGSAYFAGVSWDQVEQCTVQPHYRPCVKSPFDTSCFDQYPESGLPVDEKKPTDAVLFSDF